jgi:hypothetical protein
MDFIQAFANWRKKKKKKKKNNNNNNNIIRPFDIFRDKEFENVIN